MTEFFKHICILSALCRVEGLKTTWKRSRKNPNEYNLNRLGHLGNGTLDTPLRYAVLATNDQDPVFVLDQFATVQFLLEQKADPNYHTISHTPALHSALSGKIAQLLIDFNANINEKDKSTPLTPLMTAVAHDRESVVEILLRNHADPGLETPAGNSAIDFAISSKVRQLILREHKAALIPLFDFILEKNTAGIVISYLTTPQA